MFTRKFYKNFHSTDVVELTKFLVELKTSKFLLEGVLFNTNINDLHTHLCYEHEIDREFGFCEYDEFIYEFEINIYENNIGIIKVECVDKYDKDDLRPENIITDTRDIIDRD